MANQNQDQRRSGQLHPGPNRPRLTVAVLVRDPYAALQSTLDSIQGLADETLLLAVDSTSGDAAGSDATSDGSLSANSIDAAAQVARRYDAKLFETSWANDFSAARNFLWAQATGNWILWLDAGERLAPTGAAALREFLDKSAQANSAYMLLVVAPPALGQISSEQVGQIRLTPNRPDVRFAGRVRESIRESLAAAKLKIDGLPWRILRSPTHEPHSLAVDARRDLRLAEMQMAAEGRSAHLLVARGECLARLGNAGAMASYAEARHAAQHGSTAQREAFYGLMTALGDNSAARETLTNICLEALSVFPLDAQLLCAVGGYMQSQGRMELAETAYRTAYEHGQVDPEAWHVSDIHEIAAICLCLVLQQQARDADARQSLERALTRFPRSTRIRRHLIELCVKHDDRRRALEEVDRLPNHTAQREALRTAVRGGCLATQQDWPEAIRFLQAAYEEGCRDILCLRWLTQSLVAMGRRAEAAEIAREWQALEPESEALKAYRAALGIAPPAPAAAEATVAAETTPAAPVAAAINAPSTTVLNATAAAY